jgi:hypothetical protein
MAKTISPGTGAKTLRNLDCGTLLSEVGSPDRLSRNKGQTQRGTVWHLD